MHRNLSIAAERSLLGEIQRGLLAAVPILLGVVPFGLLLGAQAAQRACRPLLWCR